MILYIGVAGVPESLIPLEFKSLEEAKEFSDCIHKRYMESENKLFMVIEIDAIYEERDRKCTE